MRFLLLFAPKHLIFSWNRPVFLQNALFKKKKIWYNIFQEGILSGLRRRFIHPWEFPLPPFFTRVSCRVTWHSERCRV